MKPTWSSSTRSAPATAAPVEGEKPKEWHGFKKDIELVGDFIRLYTTRYNRWLSPKFLIGESYGTTRAPGSFGLFAGAAWPVSERHHADLGRVWISPRLISISTMNCPYILFLPGYAATAWYHEPAQAARPLQDLAQGSGRICAAAIMPTHCSKVIRLTKEERARYRAKDFRYYTGLSEQFIERSNLRINDHHFFKELLRERGLTVGRLDCRLIGRDRLGVTEYAEYDPLLTNIMGPYTAAFYDYVRRELKFESDLPYEILSGVCAPVVVYGV